MSKTIVLAEKPSVARELAAVLGCRTRGDGCLIGEKYIVTWALGHLVTLADPEQYDEKYKKWSMETLPMLPEKAELCVIPETKKQYAAVKKLIKDKDTDCVIIATDAGREGELVARWILEKAAYKGAIKRLWISSQTEKAIKEGFAHLKDGKDYVNLANAAKARAEADWLVGLNVTRALTCHYGASLSAGRVQTPTLALIVRREEEIKAFKPRDYFNVRALFKTSGGSFSALWKNDKKLSAIADIDTANALCAKIKGGSFTVSEITSTTVKKPSPALYDLTELQRDANKLYKLSPKETLSVMQKLYEIHKVLTYPRTDSRYLSDDIVPTLPERLRAMRVGSLSAPANDVIRSGAKIHASCVNNAKVSDHHAIIPTEKVPDFSSFTTDEKKIYLLVALRFLCCFMPDYTYKQVKATLSCGGENFYAAGKSVVDEGWKKLSVTPDEDEDAVNTDEVEIETDSLPPLAKGERLTCADTLIKAQKTSPPSRYTEASLLSAMENPSKYIADRAMKEYIGGGLGTPATRADIIEKLYSSFYIEKKDNVIHPTSKGVQIISLVPSELKEPLLTATWEQRLEAIAKGGGKKEDFIGDMKTYASELVHTVAASDAVYKHDNVTRTPCPVCGKYMLEVKGKKGKLLVCQDRSCGYRESLSVVTGARCPECHKTMELRGKDDKKIFVCSCGFKQKYDVFTAKRKENASAANKHYVSHFLQNQNKTEPKGDSAFAEALKKALAEGGASGKGAKNGKGKK